MVTLLSGRMPRQSDPGEVLASFTLARDNGVRIGSVLRPQLGTQAQLEGGKAKPSPALRPALRVVGIVASEVEFPSGASPHYDLYATTAYAAAFSDRVALLWTYYVRLAHGDADLAGFDSRFRSPDVYGTYDLDEAADAVEASIRPQVIGWYVLTGLAALAALAVIGQAMARQTVAERADHHALSALGVRPREFVLLALLRALLTGAAGAAGAVLIAVLASPLTPVGEARLAVPSPGRVSLDLEVVLPGALAVLAAVTAVSVWPAIRHARLLRNRPQWQAAPVTVAAGRAAARARLPAPALIGIRHAFERGRDGQPVGTALLGTVMAVAALCATGVFGASLTHLISSPALYGAPFQAYFASDGTPGSQARVSGPVLESLQGDGAIERITLGAFVEVNINGKHVRTVAMTPVRGAALLSTLDGRLPRGDRDIMLGVATMRATGARVGGTVRVTVADPDGMPHVASFHVIGRASLNAGTGGLGNGAVMTTRAFVSTQCPAGPKQSDCQRSVKNGLSTVVLVRAAPGAAGSAALARHTGKYPTLTYRPAEPTVLVNFGESVNFPLLFAVGPVGVRRRDAAAPAAGQRGLQARRGRVAQGAGVRPPSGRRGRLLAGDRGGAGRDRGRGTDRHRDGQGALAGIRHQLRCRAGRRGRTGPDSGPGGRGARRRQPARRRSRAAGRAITAGPAAPGGVSRWSARPKVRAAVLGPDDIDPRRRTGG